MNRKDKENSEENDVRRVDFHYFKLRPLFALPFSTLIFLIGIWFSIHDHIIAPVIMTIGASTFIFGISKAARNWWDRRGADVISALDSVVDIVIGVYVRVVYRG